MGSHAILGYMQAPAQRDAARRLAQRDPERHVSGDGARDNLGGSRLTTTSTTTSTTSRHKMRAGPSVGRRHLNRWPQWLIFLRGGGTFAGVARHH
jgi:hypothetical protein